jgi:sugar phosphate isomerase/epimerase
LLTDTVTTDLPRAVRFALLWGLEGVVRRRVGGAGDRVPFINEQAARRRLDDAGLPVAAVDPGLFEGAATARAAWLNEVDALDDTVAFCRRAGCGLVRVGALGADADAFSQEAAADALRMLAARAAREGLTLAVRNQAGTAVATGGDLGALLHAVDHASVRADWHPAEALRAGEEPGAGLRALLDAGAAVACVGVRDGAGEGAAWRDAPLGEGAVGWDEQLALLAAAGFEGPLALEVPGRPTGPAGLADATALILAIRRARRGRSVA